MDGFIHFFECFEVAVVFQGLFHDQIGEGKGLVQSFKSPWLSSRWIFMRGYPEK